MKKKKERKITYPEAENRLIDEEILGSPKFQTDRIVVLSFTIIYLCVSIYSIKVNQGKMYNNWRYSFSNLKIMAASNGRVVECTDLHIVT